MADGDSSTAPRPHTKGTFHKPCSQCGQMMSGSWSEIQRRKLCSKACQDASYSRSGSAPQMGECRTCRAPMLKASVRVKHRDGRYTRHPKIYCSQACKYAGQKVDKSWLAEQVRIALPHCRTCGNTVRNLGMRFCSTQCSKKPEVHTACRFCGAWSRGTKRYCQSGACVEVMKAERSKANRKMPSYRAGKKLYKARRRAREMPDGQPIDPIAVFRRDRWRCRLCGRKTPERLRGTTQPDAPELDHIQSLADGGSHTWSNLQCACRECNGRKGAQSLGQFHLPFAA